MSFGYSVGDVLAVGQLCWKVYKKCKDSPGNYAELTSEVGALHNVVKETEELLSQQALTSKEENKLLTCRQGCESVLKDLDGLLVKYESLGTNTRRALDRIEFGMQDINGIRLRLISNTSLLDAFNNLSSQARLENKMNILIAEVRAGKREDSVVSTKTFDASVQINPDTWEALRRDLEDVGISRDVITEKRQFIISWFQEAVAAGKLEEDPPSDDEDMAVSKSGSDGAVDESGSGSIHQRNIATMMIEPTTTEEDTSKISVPNVQGSLKWSNETTNSRGSPVKVQPSKRKETSRIGISYLFDKLGWKSDKLDWQSKQLLKAAIVGDVPRVIDSLKKGVDIEYKNKYKETALALATKKGNEPVARLLLERGANPESKDIHDDTALTAATFSGLLPMIQLLLENGADIESSNRHGDTSLMTAAWQGQHSIVRLLLEKGANTESTNRKKETALLHAAKYGHQSVARLLLEKGVSTERTNTQDETPLNRAARYGHDSVVQVLLEKGANVGATNVIGQTPLTTAVRAGHKSIVQALLEEGADTEFVANHDTTPLTIAARAGHESIVRVLLEKGANIEPVASYDGTPLMNAAGAGHKSIVGLLLENGAKIDPKDKFGDSALITAVAGGYKSIVQVLLEKGANIEFKSGYGRTPLAKAAEAGHESMIRLLLDKGANVNSECINGKTAIYYAKNKAVDQILLSAGALVRPSF